MLLMQDRVLGETMMQLVPSCSSQPLSTFDSEVSQLEFDLDLLPSLTDCVVPGSPTYQSLYSLDLPVSPTMFSPDSKSVKSPGSPYSPACRGERRVSTQSNVSMGLQDHGDSGSVVSSINLQESLAEFTQLQDRIKQENENLFDSPSSALSLESSMGLTGSYPAERFSISRESNLVFPLSPDSTQSLDVKMEPLEFLERPSLAGGPPGQTNPLLKQCLSDTSFQTRFNLKPFNFGVTTGFVTDKKTNTRSEGKEEATGHKPLKPSLSDVKIEPLLDLATGQVKKDISQTCEALSISQNPSEWTCDHLRSWLILTAQQYNIPMSLLNLDLWNMDGQALVNLTEEDFKQRLPYGHGENLFAQFDLWRTNAYYDQHQSQSYGAPPVRSCSQESQASYTGPPPPYPDYSSGEAELGPADQYSDIAYMLQMLDNQNNPVGPPQPHYVTPKVEPELSSPPPYPGAGGAESVASSDCGQETREETEEDDEEEEAETGSQKSPSRPGTNIHLWQFVKELLLQPSLYGNYIHWIDRAKGIFKIVDSVKVATLWGKRKNRPAMNYDKLSRSLRQYYKKGIMKKTERSQRLVYQFCHPYHL